MRQAFLNKILACLMPSTSLLVWWLILLNSFRNGRFSKDRVPNPKSIFLAVMNWSGIRYLNTYCNWFVLLKILITQKSEHCLQLQTQLCSIKYGKEQKNLLPVSNSGRNETNVNGFFGWFNWKFLCSYFACVVIYTSQTLLKKVMGT